MKPGKPTGKSAARAKTAAPAKAVKSAKAGKITKPVGAAKPYRKADAASQPHTGNGSAARELDPTVFRHRLMEWYRTQARTLPWRGTTDPYHIWVSEIMLQQTRVAAVVEHYNEFLRRFPTLVALALATEPDVLAAWSGLGYYRRARMLHKAAQFIVLEREGRLPATSAELRTLPGIGEYTAAAIASIAFGESVAVVDGNVERVIHRLTGRPNDATAAARAFVRAQAQALVPPGLPPASHPDAQFASIEVARSGSAGGWDAAERIALAAIASPTAPVGGADPQPHPINNVAGDHNQAMMELGATVCVPRAPLCLQCPVHALCRTRGEHPKPHRAPQRSLPAAFLLDLRKRGAVTEVLLERRPANVSLMASMYELPPLPLEVVEGREPVLRVRHAITNTNYYVQVFAPHRFEPNGSAKLTRSDAHPLRRAVPRSERDLHWTRISRLPGLPITGLTRKILQRLHVMENPRISLLE